MIAAYILYILATFCFCRASYYMGRVSAFKETQNLWKDPFK